MTPTQAPRRAGGAPVSLTLERTFKAPPERVFRMWTDPALTCQWMAPGPMTCKLPLYEARKGGRFRVEMTGPGPDGKPFTHVSGGVFEEVTPPTRLVMRWQQDPGPPTLLTVTLSPVEGGTRMVLLHEGFAAQAYADSARMGWESGFDKLGKLLHA